MRNKIKNNERKQVKGRNKCEGWKVKLKKRVKG